MLDELIKKGTLAKDASYRLMSADTETKNRALLNIADALVKKSEKIIAANRIDLDNAVKNGTKKAMLDRLMLNEERISSMAEGVRLVSTLPDPIGEITEEWERPNGLKIAKKRVPMGVIAIIYEARPNVTADACALCLKTGNAVILRGGSEAINSNKEIMKIMQEAAYSDGIPDGSINLIEDTSREAAVGLMKLNGYVDMLIPRGGQGLIRSVVENATVPIVETAAGNCHIYVDDECDFDMAEKIIINAKVSRPSVCNAAETLLISEKAAEVFLPKIAAALSQNKVEIRGCEKCRKVLSELKKAEESDWYTEYNDYIISVKIVKDIDEAIAHINKYNTGHSEAIITNNASHAERFLNEVDAACVYVNASTRFTDGFEFGFGAEIGISTQKMHARGPMGLKELTSVKYIIHGNGQIR